MLAEEVSAAFRRLCVETKLIAEFANRHLQPPSGGCVLKHLQRNQKQIELLQPPSGGCVLKQNNKGGFEQLTNSRLQAAVC